MSLIWKDPAALAGARRVNVKMRAGNDDAADFTLRPLDLQVRRVVARYAVSLPLAVAIAEIAFSSARQP